MHIVIDLSWIFPLEPSELKISISVESYDEKTAENYRYCYDLAPKGILFGAKSIGKVLLQSKYGFD